MLARHCLAKKGHRPMCQPSDSLKVFSWHSHIPGSCKIREGPVCPGGGAVSRQATGTCPSVLKSIWVNQGREGGREEGDQVTAILAGVLVIPHEDESWGPKNLRYFLHCPCPLPHTHTLRMYRQPSTLCGHDIKNEVSVIDHQLPQHREVTEDQRGEVACFRSPM